jgi:hypothetical protein
MVLSAIGLTVNSPNNAVVPRELLRAKRPADRVPVKTVGKTRAKI